MRRGAGDDRAEGPGAKAAARLKKRVKTARKRSLASTLWLERQLNDPFVARAKREGYRSRAAYKLLEIAERYRLFRPGQRIVDLGAAPGGWSQVAAAQVESAKGRGRVIGIDLLEIDPIEGVEFKVMDFHSPDAPQRLHEWLGGRADGVMSDMAANATGHKMTDHLRIVGLAELAIEFADSVLAPGGFFLAKVLQGGSEGELLKRLKTNFATVRHLKPKASRADSAELYVLAQGFRGGADARSPERPYCAGAIARRIVGARRIADFDGRRRRLEVEAHAFPHARAILLPREIPRFHQGAVLRDVDPGLVGEGDLVDAGRKRADVDEAAIGVGFRRALGRDRESRRSALGKREPIGLGRERDRRPGIDRLQTRREPRLLAGEAPFELAASRGVVGEREGSRRQNRKGRRRQARSSNSPRRYALSTIAPAP